MTRNVRKAFKKSLLQKKKLWHIHLRKIKEKIQPDIKGIGLKKNEIKKTQKPNR